MTYRMKHYQKTADGYQAVGELTLRGVTKDITLVGNFNGVAKDPWGNLRAGFNAEGKNGSQGFRDGLEQDTRRRRSRRGRDVLIKLDIECIKAKP